MITCINHNRLSEWMNNLKPGGLWISLKDGWRYRVIDQFEDDRFYCTKFRFISPQGKVYEETSRSKRRRQNPPPIWIAETIVGLIIFNEKHS